MGSYTCRLRMALFPPGDAACDKARERSGWEEAEVWMHGFYAMVHASDTAFPMTLFACTLIAKKKKNG